MHRLNQLGLPLADAIARAMATGQGTIAPQDQRSQDQDPATAGNKPGPREPKRQSAPEARGR
jgi:hypothetical protein